MYEHAWTFIALWQRFGPSKSGGEKVIEGEGLVYFCEEEARRPGASLLRNIREGLIEWKFTLYLVVLVVQIWPWDNMPLAGARKFWSKYNSIWSGLTL